MATVYVKPAPGGRVRMPERNFIPMATEGAWIERIDYYERLLIGGDIVICDPPPEPSSKPQTEAKAASTSAPARASSKEK